MYTCDLHRDVVLALAETAVVTFWAAPLTSTDQTRHYAVAAAPSVVNTPLPIDPFKRRVRQSLEQTRRALVDISRRPLYGSDGQDFRRRFSALQDTMSDTRAQLVAFQLAFDSLAAFIDENNGIRASYTEDLVLSYCSLSSEFCSD